jgi:hypothetical protein
MIGTPAHVTGSSYAPPTDLPVGTVFWRLHPSTVTSVTSPTWQFTVGARSAPVDSSWGTTLDVNGDGFADVVVGAPWVNNTGAAYVYLGGATGLATTPATTLIGPEVDGGYPDFGWSKSAGDVNGDGFADLVVAAAFHDGPDGPDCVYVYLGGVAGLADTPVSTLCLSGPNVESAGDVNGDGYADLVVSQGLGRGDTGAYVYLGSRTGLVMTPATAFSFGSAAVDYAASAGDVNGDGFGDLAVAACESGGLPCGVYIYLGSATGLAGTPATTLPPTDWGVESAGDVNGDGYADVLVAGSGLVYLGSAGGVVKSPATRLAGCCYFGRSAGDVNGDGYGDVVVLDWPSGVPVAVYLGSAAGLATAPAAAPPEPKTANDCFGQSVASAGDVNGDGFADLVVGAFCVTPGDTGSAYIYLGNVAGLATTPATTLVGSGARGGFGASVFGASD